MYNIPIKEGLFNLTHKLIIFIRWLQKFIFIFYQSLGGQTWSGSATLFVLFFQKLIIE